MSVYCMGYVFFFTYFKFYFGVKILHFFEVEYTFYAKNTFYSC